MIWFGSVIGDEQTGIASSTYMHKAKRQARDISHFTFSHENQIQFQFLPGLLKFLLGEGQDQLVVVGRPREGPRGLGGFGRRDVVEIRNGLLGAGTHLAFATGHCGWWCWYGSVAVAGRVQKFMRMRYVLDGRERLVGPTKQIVRRGPGFESRRQSLHQLVIGWDCLGYYAKAQPPAGGEPSKPQPKPRPGQRTGGESASASTSEEQ